MDLYDRITCKSYHNCDLSAFACACRHLQSKGEIVSDGPFGNFFSSICVDCKIGKGCAKGLGKKTVEAEIKSIRRSRAKNGFRVMRYVI